MMHIEYWHELPPGKPVIAEFTLWLDDIGIGIKDMKVYKGKGGTMVFFPSKGVQDYMGKIVYTPRILIRNDKQNFFKEKLNALVEPFLQTPVAQKAEEKIKWTAEQERDLFYGN